MYKGLINLVVTKNAAKQAYECLHQGEAISEAYYEQCLREVLEQGKAYVFDVTHRTEGEKQYIYLTLATDSENEYNQQFYNRYPQKTLRLEGCLVMHLGYESLRLTGVRLYEGSYRGEQANYATRLSLEVNYRRPYANGGISQDDLTDRNNVYLYKQSQKVLEENIQKWEHYLEILEKQIEANQMEMVFSKGHLSVDCDVLWLKVALEDEVWKKIHQMIGWQVSLAGEGEEDGEYIGNLEIVRQDKKQIGIGLHFEYQQAAERGYWQGAKTGRVQIFSFGERSQINRLKQGMKRLKKQQALQPRLSEFLFDGEKVQAIPPNKRIYLKKDELLIPELNTRQKQAVEGVLSAEDLFLIQGPPGTGKTTVIAEICYQNAKRGLKTLISSQTNLAVDNAMGRLVHCKEVVPLRAGNASSIEPEGMKYAAGHVIEGLLQATKEKVGTSVVEMQAELERWQGDISRQLQVEHNFLACQTSCEMWQEKLLKVKKEFDCLLEQEQALQGLLENYQNPFVLSELVAEPIFLEPIQRVKQWQKAYEDLEVDRQRLSQVTQQAEVYVQVITQSEQLRYKLNQMRLVVKLDNKKYHDYNRVEGEWLVKQLEKVIALAPNPLVESPVLVEIWREKTQCLLGQIEVYVENYLKQEMKSEEQLQQLISRQQEVKVQLDGAELALEEVVAAQRRQIQNNLDDLREEKDKLNQSIKVLEKETLELRGQLNTLEAERHALKEEYHTEEEKAELFKRIEQKQRWQACLEQMLNKEDKKYFKDLETCYRSRANVIGITCVQAGSKKFSMDYPDVDVVIVDETSKATPPELLLPILKAKKIVLVGDHKQLAPMVGGTMFTELAKEYGYSKEELLMLEESLFEKLYYQVPETNKVMLNQQYRMHEQIMEVVNTFYGEEEDEKLQYGLVNKKEVRPHHCEGGWISKDCHTLWVDMPLSEAYREQEVGYSFSNPMEVETICKVLTRLQQNYKTNGHTKRQSVGVIAFYGEQVRLIKKKIGRHEKEWPLLHIRVGTVDKFQGIEREIILLSCVRNNKGTSQRAAPSIGYAQNPKRINVAMSRAKSLLMVIGCSELFTECIEGRAREDYEHIYQTIRLNGGVRDGRLVD